MSRFFKAVAKSSGLLILLVAFLPACARLNSIHRTTNVPEGKAHILSIDAKQRVVLSNPSLDPAEDSKDHFRRFCAEPPPDVFTAIASSFGANASYAVGAADQQAALQLSSAMNENASSIERSQTVNILREMMYRNCERYMNNAITTDEFIVQAARDQRAIVSVLAIEQLTGVSKSKAATLTTKAEAATAGANEFALKAHEAARQEELKLELEATAARDKALKLAPAGPCDPLPAVDPANANSATELATKKTECKKAADADAKVAEATAHKQVLRTALEKMGSTSATTSGDADSAELKGAAASAEIAKAVVDIVRENNNFDEIEMTCVVLFRNYAKNVEAYANAAKQMNLSGTDIKSIGAMLDRCLSLLDKAFEAKSKMYEARTEKMSVEIQENKARAKFLETKLVPADADSLWILLGGGTSEFLNNTNAMIKKLSATSNPLNSSLENALTQPGIKKDVFEKIIGAASPETRNAMISAARSQ